MALRKLKKLWKQQFPNDEFDYEFLDATIAKFYRGEQHISSLLKWSTGLAIFISCLGLLGLVMYTTHLRTKEIGVRKSIGATVTQIFSLISRDFLKLVLIAFVIATPFAYWALHNWLIICLSHQYQLVGIWRKRCRHVNFGAADTRLQIIRSGQPIQ
jgi:ABC-type antimicrobial peptide transport system permease subunit